jgi:arsenical pump membrane protein
VLIGVNVGPNLTYVGSLANLLWRNAVRHDIAVSHREFTRIGLCTVPATLVASVVGLWLGIELLGV